MEPDMEPDYATGGFIRRDPDALTEAEVERHESVIPKDVVNRLGIEFLRQMMEREERDDTA